MKYTLVCANCKNKFDTDRDPRFTNYCAKEECAEVDREEAELKQELEFQLKDALDFVNEKGAGKIDFLQGDAIKDLIIAGLCWDKEDLSIEAGLALDILSGCFPEEDMR